MVKFMKQIADSNNIKWQPEILTGGGTDTMGIQQFTAGGSIAGAISIPTRHIHQVIETCAKEDIEGSIDLLVNCIRSISDYDWSH
jgi:endoglucanase